MEIVDEKKENGESEEEGRSEDGGPGDGEEVLLVYEYGEG